jgi:hypothetical protein
MKRIFSALIVVIFVVAPSTQANVEDTMQGNSMNGVENTGQIMQLGQVVFGTALLLQIIKGMLD